MERKNVLLVLAVGFGVVTVLLVLAAFISLRSLRAIQMSTERLLEERRPTAGLIEALDRENARLGSLLIRLTDDGGSVTDPATVLTTVQGVHERVAQLAHGAHRNPKEWVHLLNVTRSLQQVTREGLSDGRVTPIEMERVIGKHMEYMRATSELLRSSYRHTNDVQAVIRGQSQKLAGESSWLLAICVLIGAAAGGFSIHLASDAFQRLEWRTEELNRVSWHMLQGQEAAARCFSHEMHDELGQVLTVTRATLTTVSGEEFENRRDSYLEALDQAVSATRELSQLLRPVILDDFGLNEALRWMSERFQDRTGVACAYQSDFNQRLADETETHLFRISQESLTNIARHSGATQISMSLCRQGDSLTLEVADNGCGLPPKGRRKGPSLGVIGMQARARQIGGELHMGQSTLGGALIRVTAPIRRRTDDAV